MLIGARQYIEPIMPRLFPPAPPLRGSSAWLGHWPNRCAVCRAYTAGAHARVCTDCIDRFAAPRPRCSRCALQCAGGGSRDCGNCLRMPPSWSRAIAACDYGYPWDRLLTDFKFHAALDLLPALAGLLASRLPPEAADVDLLLPVPLSPARWRERGYNQAGLLAGQLAKRLHRPCSADALLRVSDTPHQIALPRERRAANVRGAFAIAPGARLQGRRIALIDDVMTTGATLGELARVLLEGGAADVEVWVFARTPA
jgi:ComF family protein